jgi:Mce-associated membrane protein
MRTEADSVTEHDEAEVTERARADIDCATAPSGDAKADTDSKADAVAKDKRGINWSRAFSRRGEAATTPVAMPDTEPADTTLEIDTGTPSPDDIDEADPQAGDTAAEDVEAGKDSDDAAPARDKRRINWSRVLVFGVLPGLVLVFTLAAAFFKWEDGSMRMANTARIESVQAAKDSTVALLSYRPDTVDKDLVAARERLTGDFKNAYTQLTDDVVIPGSKKQNVTATANIPSAASVSATANHAVVLLFVDQTTTVGTGAPSNLQSSVRVTVEKIGDRWLISGFDPV